MTHSTPEVVAGMLARIERQLALIIAAVDRDEMLTEREAAELRGKTIYALRKERARRAGPPYVKDGASIRYSRRELGAWLEERRQESRDSERRPRFASRRLDLGRSTAVDVGEPRDSRDRDGRS